MRTRLKSDPGVLAGVRRQAISDLRRLYFSKQWLVIFGVVIVAVGLAYVGARSFAETTQSTFVTTVNDYQANGISLDSALSAPVEVSGSGGNQTITNPLRFDFEGVAAARNAVTGLAFVSTALDVAIFLVLPLLLLFVGGSLALSDRAAGLARCPRRVGARCRGPPCCGLRGRGRCDLTHLRGCSSGRPRGTEDLADPGPRIRLWPSATAGSALRAQGGICPGGGRGVLGSGVSIGSSEPHHVLALPGRGPRVVRPAHRGVVGPAQPDGRRGSRCARLLGSVQGLAHGRGRPRTSLDGRSGGSSCDAPCRLADQSPRSRQVAGREAWGRH